MLEIKADETLKLQCNELYKSLEESDMTDKSKIIMMWGAIRQKQLEIEAPYRLALEEFGRNVLHIIGAR